MANILIIKLGALGDVVMSTSLIKQIQSCHPSDALFLLTTKPLDTVFHNWENLNVHTVERKGFKNSLRTIAWVRKNNFESVYDLQSNDRTGLYCAFSRIRRRIGNHPRYPYNVHPEDSYQGQCHIYSRMLTVLESANIPVKLCKPSLPASGEEQRRIRTWLKENKLIENNFIIIHAGGSKQHPEKRWPYFEQLATKLFTMDKMIVWVGGCDDIKLNEKLSSIAGINASSMFTFSELAELGRHASFALANDSGPMHILSCSGIPVYGLFGPTNWRRNHAVDQEDRVISAQFDRGSLINDRPFKPESLDTISTKIVLNRLTSDGML